MWWVACYLTRCSAGVSPDDPNYNQLKEWEIWGASCVHEIEVLIGNISFTADGYDNYSRIKDALSRNEKYINGYGAGGAKVATGLIGGTSGMGLVVAGGEASVASGGASLVLSGIGFWMIDLSVNEGARGLDQIINTYKGYEYQYGDRVLSAFSSHDNSIYFNPLKDTADFVGKAAFEMAVSVIGFKLAKLVDKVYELGKRFKYGKNASANQFSGKIEQPKVQKPKGNDKPATTGKGNDKPETTGNVGNQHPNDIIYSKSELDAIMKDLEKTGFKNSPVRKKYEQEIVDLTKLEDKLRAEGRPLEEIARTLYQARRDLGVKYKDMTPKPLRDYIYEVNRNRYGDPLGPSWEQFKRDKSYEQIIESASRPNSDVDRLLADFEQWARARSK